MLGVCGLDFLVQERADADRLAGLFERGVRVFQLVGSTTGRLAGSAGSADDRGLTELGRSCLSRIAEMTPNGDVGSRPILDLAHLNERSMTEVIDAVVEAVRAGRLLLIYSHGAIAHSGSGGPRAIDRQNLARLRAVGGVVGLTPAHPITKVPKSSTPPSRRSHRSHSKAGPDTRGSRSLRISSRPTKRYQVFVTPTRSGHGSRKP